MLSKVFSHNTIFILLCTITSIIMCQVVIKGFCYSNWVISGVAHAFQGSPVDSYLLGVGTERSTKQTIVGRVIGGGDTTPEGVFDTPRKFVYDVEKSTGEVIQVMYTAYPPSPVGDRERAKIRLSFHSGRVETGDYLKAHGSFDEGSKSLSVADAGDYIETSVGISVHDFIEPSTISIPDEEPPPSTDDVGRVSNLLLSNFGLKRIDVISQRPTHNFIYYVTAVKEGKLFSIIPVSFPVLMEFDAATDSVIKMDGPWWAFLINF